MYLAGNQFMVMQELIGDFQAKNPDIKTVYVETIPPGQILKGQLLKQGEIEGQPTAMNPDIFASVNIGHLKKLNEKELMNEHIIYIHNKLELMVAAGNPKGIKGPEDLARDDLVQSHPNPLTEGIFKFYGSEMLKDLGLYKKVTGGAEIPAPLNKQDKVNYAIGIMSNGRNPGNAARYLACLGTDEAQSIYEKYGFIRATPGELTPKSL